jgi:RHS repeat-associated protein
MGVTTYAYDDLYRLTEVTYPGPETDTYTYDPVGNRLTLNAVGYTYDDADEMLAADEAEYGYDDNGNQTSRDSDSFAYDHENRLTQAIIGGNTSTYAYNGDGLRASQTVGGNAVWYTWDVNAGLPVILQDSLDNTYVYGLDLISRTDGSSNQEYHLYDGLGSTVDVMDDSGGWLAGYVYDAFGSIRFQGGSSGNQWLFTGEQRDSESGSYYLRARYYDPAVGRFLSRDPLPTGNPYAYVANNPLVYVDPMGLCHERLGYDQVCRLVHELTIRQEFSGEWEVRVERMGAGGPGTVVKFILQGTVTSTESGSETRFVVTSSDTRAFASEATVFYRSGQRRSVGLVRETPPGVGMSDPGFRVMEPKAAGLPTKIELKLSRNPLKTDIGTCVHIYSLYWLSGMLVGGGGMRPEHGFAARLLAAALLVALTMPGCGDGGTPEGRVQCGGSPSLGEAMESAEGMLDFEVLVPTYLPATTSSIAELTIHPRDEVRILFDPCPKTPADVVGPAIIVTETTEIVAFEPDYSDPLSERIEIRGTSAEMMQANPPDRATSTAVLVGWHQAGLSLSAHFTWASREGPPPEITSDMKAEAIRVVESIIQQGDVTGSGQ